MIAPGRRWLTLAIVMIAHLVASEASAAVLDSPQTEGAFTVYLGVVPAAVTRGHVPTHVEAEMHGGPPQQGRHAVHLVAAVFYKTSGKRVETVEVTARISSNGTEIGVIPLKKMSINGALTYGGYATLTTATNYQIRIDVLRRQRTRMQHPTTVGFTYWHD